MLHWNFTSNTFTIAKVALTAKQLLFMIASDRQSFF